FPGPNKGVKLVGDDSFDAIEIATGSTLVLDCRPTHPNDKVTLDFWGTVEPTADGRISFDPKKGYIIKNVTKDEDEGDYTCTPYKKITVTIEDKIATLPKAEVEQPANQHFVVGEDITLICKPSIRDFKYVLKANWTTPRGRRLHDITYNGTDTDPRSTLHVRNATMEDSGNYTCSISGPCKIYDQPEMTTVPIQIQASLKPYVMLNSSSRMFELEPSQTFNWTTKLKYYPTGPHNLTRMIYYGPNGKILSSATKFKIDYDEFGSISSLIIAKVNPKDFGNYSLQVTTSDGSASQTSTVLLRVSS
ncbi:unnamed protein product, partial [Meganyctiphanes norvegica]